MDLFTNLIRIACSGSAAFFQSRNMRDPMTRLSTLIEAKQVEYGAASFIDALSKRATLEGDTWLAEKLALHAADEARHGKIFEHALKQLAPEKQELPKRNPFYTAYLDGYLQDLQPETIEWTVFMGSMYILERDSSREFVHMANAIPEDNRCLINLKKGMLNIAKDETYHAAYLYEAMQRRLGSNVDNWVNEWRTRQIKAMLTLGSDFILGTERPVMHQDGSLFCWA